MKLYALSSTEELLEKVDVLCVPASKDRAESVSYTHLDVYKRQVFQDIKIHDAVYPHGIHATDFIP